MTTTIILSDDNTSEEMTFSAATKSDAFRQLYNELARRNTGDCSGWIAKGFVPAPGAVYPHDISLDLDPAEFWSACVSIMLADTQDWRYAD